MQEWDIPLIGDEPKMPIKSWSVTCSDLNPDLRKNRRMCELLLRESPWATQRAGEGLNSNKTLSGPFESEPKRQAIG